MIDTTQVHEGMVVRGSTGKKLGRVVSSTERSFVFEDGLFSVSAHAVRYDDVAEIAADTIQLSRSWEESAQHARALSMGHERRVAWPSYGDEGGGGLL